MTGASTIYWTITIEPADDGWSWRACGVNEAGETWEDDSAGDAFATAALARQDAEDEIRRKADLDGGSVAFFDEAPAPPQ